ncbi:hypothetical protein WJX72_003552 [[Myrmecia] bisecta]|uniref:EF-hand domain-containing protein n=1 Tax=[Myrmecia] bisecta TaxID=41462 RepID=A0AAW1P827_9CHLO
MQQQAASGPAFRKHACESFQLFDEGTNGWLDRSGVKCALASLLGYKPTPLEVDRVMQRCPCGQVDMTTFVQYAEARLAMRDPDEHMRNIFKAFDQRRAGFITCQDLHTAVQQSAPHIPARTVDTMFDELDADGDGRVSCREFMAMMRTPLQ